MEETTITFTLDGPKLKEAVPLLDVLVSLQEFHHIIDKAYLSTTGGDLDIYQNQREPLFF